MPNRAGPPPVANQERALTVVEHRLDDVVKGLNNRADQFTALLGAENRERWLAVALHALASNKNVLQNCTVLSIIEAIRESAALGLSPTGLLGEGWILPYADQAKFMPGYRGYLKLLRNSGQIKIADSQLVYMNDEFSVQLGTDPKIHHVPVLYGEKNEDGTYLAERGDYRGAYAWVRLTSGETVIEWMTLDDLMKIKEKSPSARKGEGPWVTDPGEMMRKSPIRRVVKRLPLESMPKLARAAVLDEEADVIEGTAQEVPQGAASNRATAAAYALARGQGDEQPEAGGTSETPEPQGEAEPTVITTSVTPAFVPEPSPCLAPSPYGDGEACRKPADHPGNHQSPGGTW